MASRPWTKTGQKKNAKSAEQGANPAYMREVLGSKRVFSDTPVSLYFRVSNQSLTHLVL
jgi:hypothetical protein